MFCGSRNSFVAKRNDFLLSHSGYNQKHFLALAQDPVSVTPLGIVVCPD